MASKSKTLVKHARRRALERHGVDLHQDLLSKLVKQIQSGGATLIDRQSGRVTRWWVKLPNGGGTIPVVYDTQRKVIVTVLKKEHIGSTSVKPPA